VRSYEQTVCHSALNLPAAPLERHTNPTSTPRNAREGFPHDIGAHLLHLSRDRGPWAPQRVGATQHG
jgi:hypothetical protein